MEIETHNATPEEIAEKLMDYLGSAEVAASASRPYRVQGFTLRVTYIRALEFWGVEVTDPCENVEPLRTCGTRETIKQIIVQIETDEVAAITARLAEEAEEFLASVAE